MWKKIRKTGCRSPRGAAIFHRVAWKPTKAPDVSCRSFAGDPADTEQLGSLGVIILGLSLMDGKYFP